MAQSRKTTIFVTGFPQYTTRRLVAHLARTEPKASLWLLASERHVKEAEQLVKTLPGRKDRYRVFEGHVRKMDLGLSGDEWSFVSKNVNVIHHMASVFHLGVDAKVAHDVNVQGAAEVIELARSAPRLQRLVHYSTVGVSGDHRGVWAEEDLERGQSFNNHYEETKFLAEKAIHQAAGLPVTILRSPVLVGDSVTGQIDRFDGPYQLMLLFIALPVDLGLPLPGRAARLINLVPVDFFVRAASVLGTHPEGVGQTYHIVDPEPLTMEKVFQLVAQASEKKVPRGYIPAPLTRGLMRTPGLERFAESPVAALDLFTTDVVFASSAAQELLREAGVSCPRFPEYVENLVGFLRQKIEQEGPKPEDSEVYDPLW